MGGEEREGWVGGRMGGGEGWNGERKDRFETKDMNKSTALVEDIGSKLRIKVGGQYNRKILREKKK